MSIDFLRHPSLNNLPLQTSLSLHPFLPLSPLLTTYTRPNRVTETRPFSGSHLVPRNTALSPPRLFSCVLWRQEDPRVLCNSIIVMRLCQTTPSASWLWKLPSSSPVLFRLRLSKHRKRNDRERLRASGKADRGNRDGYSKHPTTVSFSA